MGANSVLSDHDKLVLAVVYLKSQGYAGRDIADILTQNGFRLDEPRVSVLNTDAERKGWLRIATVFDEDSLSAELVEEIQTMTSPNQAALIGKLQKLGGSGLKKLYIFYSGQKGVTKECWDARLAHFSRLAARCVIRLLRGATKVGIGWGHTLTTLVDAVESIPGFLKGAQNLLFVPTSGEPLGPAARQDRSSSTLVSRAHMKQGGATKPLSLKGVCAVWPAELKEPRKRRSLEEYFDLISDFTTIFSGQKPLVLQLDTVITSVGSFTGQWQMYQSELIRTGGTRVENLREVALGDIGGALIPKANLNAFHQRQIRSIAESWTGITLDHYKTIASRAAKSEKPGVVVVAIGANKADVVLQAVRLGLVNQLIVDHDLAEKLQTY